MQVRNLISLLLLCAYARSSSNSQDEDFDIDMYLNLDNDIDYTTGCSAHCDFNPSTGADSTYPSYGSMSDVASFDLHEMNVQRDPAQDDFNCPLNYQVSSSSNKDEATISSGLGSRQLLFGDDVTLSSRQLLFGDSPGNRGDVTLSSRQLLFGEDTSYWDDVTFSSHPSSRQLLFGEEQVSISEAVQYDQNFIDISPIDNHTDFDSPMEIEQNEEDEQIEWSNLVSAFTEAINQEIDNKTMLETLVVLVHEGQNIKVRDSLVHMMSTEYGIVKVLQDMIFQYRWSQGMFPYTLTHSELFKHLSGLVAVLKPTIILDGLQERLQKCLSQTTNVDVKRDIKSIMSDLLKVCGGNVLDSSHNGDSVLESALLYFELRMLSHEELAQALAQNLTERTKYLVQRLCQKNPETANIDWSFVTMEDMQLRLVEELKSIEKQSASSRMASISKSSSSTHSDAPRSAPREAPKTKMPKRKLKTGAYFVRMVSEIVNTLIPANAKTPAVNSVRRVLYFFMTRFNISVPDERLKRESLTRNYRFVTITLGAIREYRWRLGESAGMESEELIKYAFEVIKKPENLNAFVEPTDPEIMEYLKVVFCH